jgi:hypothetical protein
LLHSDCFLQFPQCCTIVLCIHCFHMVQGAGVGTGPMHPKIPSVQLLCKLLEISCPSTIQSEPCILWLPFLWVTEETFWRAILLTWWNENRGIAVGANTETSHLFHRK